MCASRHALGLPCLSSRGARLLVPELHGDNVRSQCHERSHRRRPCRRAWAADDHGRGNFGPERVRDWQRMARHRRSYDSHECGQCRRTP